MRTSEIGTIISTAITLGMINYRTMIEPASDKIKQREAKRYLVKLGYKPSVLENMTSAGLIHRKKDGDGNSPIYYSAKELQKALLTLAIQEEEIKNK